MFLIKDVCLDVPEIGLDVADFCPLSDIYTFTMTLCSHLSQNGQSTKGRDILGYKIGLEGNFFKFRSKKVERFSCINEKYVVPLHMESCPYCVFGTTYIGSFLDFPRKQLSLSFLTVFSLKTLNYNTVYANCKYISGVTVNNLG